jgi:hypothetical protein
MAWFKKSQPAEAPAETPNSKAADDMVDFEAQDEVPRDPRDWPTGKMQYLTFGTAGDDAYGEGATAKLGPAEVAHHEDGSVSVGGELVDDPSKYKGKPITGGIIDQITKHADRNAELRKQEEAEGRG